MRALLLAAAVGLSACQSVPEQPRVRTVEVKVPVAVPCLPPELPKRPAIAAPAALRALDDYDLVLELAAERDELIGYTAELEAVLKACR